MSENDSQMRQLNLSHAVTAAIAQAKLPWPEYGQVIVRTLTDFLGGNRVVIQVHEGGTVLEFDGEGVRGWTTAPQGLAKEMLNAMPGETLEERLSCALHALGGAAQFRGLPVRIEWRVLRDDANS